MHIRQLFDLSGQVGVVTGASAGLGVWFAKGLAEAGANVVLAARRFKRLESLSTELLDLGVESLPIMTDITEEDQVQAMVESTLREFGRIDILVNNAGIGPDEDGFVDATPLDVSRAVFEVNLFGTWQCCAVVGRKMLEQGNGKIINIASVDGLRASPYGPNPAYGASKAAVINFSRELAWEWASRGVIVHCVAPGLFLTEMTATDLEDPELMKGVLAGIPLGSIGDEDHIKGLIVFLASSASDYLLGHPIVFDGGMMLT